MSLAIALAQIQRPSFWGHAVAQERTRRGAAVSMTKDHIAMRQRRAAERAVGIMATLRRTGKISIRALAEACETVPTRVSNMLRPEIAAGNVRRTVEDGVIFVEIAE